MKSTPEIKIKIPEMQPKPEIIGGYVQSITDMEESKIQTQPQITKPITPSQIIPPQMPIHMTPKPMIRPQIMNNPIQAHAPFTISSAIPLGKLSQIFSDPGVSSIECLGPGKNVIVHKSGITQTTQVILTQNEIDEILKIVSEKTKIPLIKGVFKAALENMLVTAVISEFVGTRFYIEKLRIHNAPHMG